MTPARWSEIDRLFAAVVERPAAERGAALAQLAGEDRELRREVEALLAADALPAPFLDDPVLAPPAEEPGPPAAGARVGPYRLLRELGRGGTSVVYLAQRDDQRYEREVAIKICRRELLAGFRRSGFATEARILARLEHPSIARLYDAGSTERGLPYFVLELIEGSRIDDYCEEHRLPAEGRVRLVVAVCAAVHYAHQRLVIHRDLKPSNILVADGGAPKLLDFGIAKLLDPRPEPAREHTATAWQPMTPQYASPEQLLGEPMTTAADVYSLGVVLYKLIGGRLPFQGLTTEEIRARFAADLSPPGLELAAPAADPDLVAIVGKALRREPEHRYGSAAELADDLDRFLAGLPVRARAGSLRYRAGKLLSRHRLGLAAAGAFLVLAAAFTASTARQSAEIEKQRDQAEQTLGFLVELFDDRPASAAGGPLTAAQLLERGAARAARLEGPPELKAALLDRLGMLNCRLGYFRRARPLLEQALALERGLYGSDHPEVASSLSHLAWSARGSGEWKASAELYTRTVEIRRRHLPASDPLLAESLGSLAGVQRDLGDLGAAERSAREALAIWRRSPTERPELARSLAQLGDLLRRLGRREEAEPLLSEALAAGRRAGEAASGDLPALCAALALLYAEDGRFAQAEALLREAVEASTSVFGADHPQVFAARNNLGRCLEKAGKLQEAEGLHRANLDLLVRRGMERHPDFATVLHNLGTTLATRGDFAGAEQALRKACSLRQELLGPDHLQLGESRYVLAELLARLDHRAEAEELYRAAETAWQRSLPPGHAKLVTVRSRLQALAPT